MFFIVAEIAGKFLQEYYNKELEELCIGFIWILILTNERLGTLVCWG